MQINSVNFQNKLAFGNNPYKKGKEVSNEKIGEEVLYDASRGCNHEAKIMEEQDYLKETIDPVIKKGELLEKIAFSDEPKDKIFKSMVGKHIRTYA